MSFSVLLYVSLIVIVVFIILNTLLMSVLERTREFGMLLALGMRPDQIGRMVWLELLFLAGTGSAIGIALGARADELVRAQRYRLRRGRGAVQAMAHALDALSRSQRDQHAGRAAGHCAFHRHCRDLCLISASSAGLNPFPR